MFTLFNRSYKLNYRKLTEEREKKDISMKQFALLCDWSYQYQWKLENGYVENVSEETKNVIEDVLKGE